MCLSFLALVLPQSQDALDERDFSSTSLVSLSFGGVTHWCLLLHHLPFSDYRRPNETHCHKMWLWCLAYMSLKEDWTNLWQRSYITCSSQVISHDDCMQLFAIADL